MSSKLEKKTLELYNVFVSIVFNIIKYKKQTGLFMNATRKEIYKHILTRIADSELTKGDRIPTEMELAKAFNTNRMNAHLAVKELEKEGIVKRNKRQGTIVAKNVAKIDIDDLKASASSVVYALASPADKRFNIHWNESTLLEFETLLNKKGYRIHHDELPHELEKLKKLVGEISKKGVKALVLLPCSGGTKIILENSECFENFSGDIIMLNRGAANLAGFSGHTVGFDPYEEGVIAGKYLKEKGINAKNVFYLGYIYEIRTETAHWVKQRYEGLKFALGNPASLDLRIIDKKKSGAAIKEIVDNSNEKPMIVTCNDGLAASALDGAKEYNLSAPKDFSIIGFDNALEYRNHNLTTVASSIDKIGAALAEMITTNLQWKKDTAQINLHLKPRIIERSTCQ